MIAGIGLLAGVAGCATRPKAAPGVRTITSVGGSPETVVAGTPGSSRSSRPLGDERPPRGQERISGRVVDERGRPVPNVEVRLADGTAAAGRDNTVTTDESGGFTLSGVRPGRRYTLIAERAQGRRWYFGRLTDVEAPDRSVEIEVRDQTPSQSSRRVGRVSNLEETADDPAADTPRQRPRKRSTGNDDDLPPARAADDIRGPASTPAQTRGSGWQSSGGGDFSSSRSTGTPTAALSTMGLPVHDLEENNPLPPAREKPLGTVSQSERMPSRDPAPAPERFPIEPEGTRTSAEGSATDEPFTSGQGPLVTEFGSAAADAPRAPATVPGPAAPEANPAQTSGSLPATQGGTSPRPLPRPQPAGSPFDDPPALPANPAEFPPASATDPWPEPRTTAPSDPGPNPGLTGAREAVGSSPPLALTRSAQEPEPTPAEAENSLPSPSESTTAGHSDHPKLLPGDERADEVPRPTWSELTSQVEAPRVEPEVPLAAGSSFPRSVRRTGQPLRLANVSPNREPAPRRGAASPDRRMARRDAAVTTASCEFDNRRKRLVDFQIPDLDGKPVRFSDIDADYVLLDFWGSWCGPCLKAIPHLVELQSQYDPKRFRVLGIAYETGPPDGRLAATEAAATSLGVNYPVLQGEADGKPCPLAAALHVQSYPTMILVDRQGRIVWRDSGASPPTLERLERVVASSMKNAADTVRR